MIRAALMADIKVQQRKVNMPALDFRAEFKPSTLNAEKRTVDMTWTTGARVMRGFWDPYYEELSLDPSHVRMGRLQSGNAPLLNSHNSDSIDDVIGVVESARLDPGGMTGSATVRFDSGPAGADALRKVGEGILRNVSVGYRTYKMQKIEDGDDTTPVYRAVDWEPYELSMVPIGADAGAATRAATSATNPCVFTEERAMPDPVLPITNTPAPALAVVTDVERAAEMQRAVAQETDRVLGIQRTARALGRSEAEATKAIADKTSLDVFSRAAIDARAKSQEEGGEHTEVGGGHGGIRVQVGATGGEKWGRAVSAALFNRCGSEATDALKRNGEKTGEKIDLDDGEFRGLRMLDLARACLDRNRVSYRGMGALQTIGLALSEGRSQDSDSFFTNRSPAQSTSDFSHILENVLHKLLLAQYGITPDTWRKMATVGSAVDFRPNPRYRLGSIAALSSLDELGEFKNTTMNDAEKQLITVVTKGNILALSRQTLLNDDMSAFSRAAMMFGRAAALSIESDFYALLAQNGGLGPSLFDGNSLFFARTNGNNIGAGGAAISSATIDADRVLMKGQLDPSGNEVLDLRPWILLVPASLGGQARQIVTGQYDFDALTVGGAARSTYQIPNRVGGIFAEVIDTARLTGTRRYAFADPAIAPVIEVVFLDGQQQPYMEMRQGWRIDGIEWKIRLDYAVGGIDFRGATTNPGV